MVKKTQPPCALIEFCNIDLDDAASVEYFENLFRMAISIYKASDLKSIQDDFRALLISIIEGSPNLPVILRYLTNIMIVTTKGKKIIAEPAPDARIDIRNLGTILANRYFSDQENLDLDKLKQCKNCSKFFFGRPDQDFHERKCLDDWYTRGIKSNPEEYEKRKKSYRESQQKRRSKKST
jgi:hypothetical protein